MTPNLTMLRQQTTQLAREAGAILMEYFSQPIKVMYKKNVFDVVTEADRAAEAHIVSAIQAAYPSHHIVGEEGGSQGAAQSGADYHWYIDPLDGTTNFANKIPFFSVSIALTDKDNRPLVGAVYDPNSNMLYSAVRGAGATCNDEPIHVSNTPELKQSVIATNYPLTETQYLDDAKTRRANFFAPRVRGIRRYGSAALELCWVGRGILDGYWEYGIQRWDYMAGLLIVQEAGGTVTDYYGEFGANLFDRGQILASNGHIHDEIVDGMKNVVRPAVEAEA